MATVTTTARVYCPLPSTVVVTPSASARVIVDDRESGGAVIQVIASETSFSVPAGGSFQIDAIGGDVTYSATVSIEAPDGGVYATATAGTPGTTLTATGTGYASPCEFWGIEVSAYNGGPQTVVVRNGGSGGAIVATFTVSGVGFYSYSGAWNAPGNGQNLSRAMSTDVHLTITGGTSRSITPIVSPV